MFVNRRKIRIGSVTGETIDFNIPIEMNIAPLDNEDLVKTTFVDEEVEKAINETTDFKKVRFKPATVKNGVWTIVPEIKIELKFFKSDGTYSNEYASLGFTSEDIFCRVNRVMKSFLSLDYYNTTNSSENILLTGSDIYTQIGDDQTNEIGIPLKANFNPISYRLGDPTLRPKEVHEGFHIFWFSNDILNAENYEYVIYLSPTYQNAGDGTVSIMTPVKGSFNFNELNMFGLGGDTGTQYIKVILKYQPSTGDYMYTISHNNESQLKTDQNPDGGIDWNNDEEGHIPTLTLYQLQPTNPKNFSNIPPSSTTSTENTDDSSSGGFTGDNNFDTNLDFRGETANVAQPPTLGATTQNTTGTNVVLNGSVVDNGGATISEKGFVYSTSQTPTTSSSTKIIDSNRVSTMRATINDLAEGTYYARAFATNSVGTAYSNQVTIEIVVVDTTTDTSTDGGWSGGQETLGNYGSNTESSKLSLDMVYRNTSSSFLPIGDGGTINHKDTYSALEIKPKVVNDSDEEQVGETWEITATDGLLSDKLAEKYSSGVSITIPNTKGTHTLTFAPSNNIANEVTITIRTTGR